MADYIPSRDANLADWMNNFSTLITGSPGTYALTAGDATTIATYVSAFVNALTVVSNPATKTRATVAAKDGAKAAMLDIVRPYAQQVRANRGVSNEHKVALGLTIADETRTPIPAPATNPILMVIGATPGEHTVRFADSATPDRRKKPFGAIGLQLFVVVAAAPVNDPAAAEFRSFVTKQPFAVMYEAADNGKVATYFARWQTRTGLVGPWSTGVAFTIAA